MSEREGWIELEGEWVCPCERPEWGRADAEWWWAVDEYWRPLVDDERGHKCSVRSCPSEAVLVRLEQVTRWDTGTRYERRSFRCGDHIYGELVEDSGRVLRRRPRFVKVADW